MWTALAIVIATWYPNRYYYKSWPLEFPLELVYQFTVPSRKVCEEVQKLEYQTIWWWDYLYTHGYCTQKERAQVMKAFKWWDDTMSLHFRGRSSKDRWKYFFEWWHLVGDF